MSGRGRRVGGTIWLFVFVLLASAGGIAILGAAAARGSHFEPYSTFRAEPDGASACFDTLAHPDLGFDCRRETEELIDLPDDGSLVFLIHPCKDAETAAVVSGTLPSPFGPGEAFSEREIDALLRWVKRGGRLAIFECFENSLYRTLGITAGGVATIAPLGPIASGRPAALSPLTEACGRLALGCRANLASESGDWVPVFVTEAGAEPGDVKPVFIAARWGKGRVYACADPSILTNEGITRGDHVELLRAIAEDSPRRSRIVRFDELRHGFKTERNVMGFARRYGLHVVLVQASLTFVLAIWAAARPRRRVRGAGLEKGIESREFVSAMANIYARAGLQQHAVRSYERRCERVIALATGAAPGDLERAELARRLRVLGVQNYRGWESVREEALAIAVRSGTRSVGERRLVSFARLAVQLEREVREAARLKLDQVIG